MKAIGCHGSSRLASWAGPLKFGVVGVKSAGALIGGYQLDWHLLVLVLGTTDNGDVVLNGHAIINISRNQLNFEEDVRVQPREQDECDMDVRRNWPM